MFTKQQTISLVSLLITLVVAHALNRQLAGSEDSFLNAKWGAGVAGVAAGVITNMLLTPKLLAWIQKTANYTEKRMLLINDIVNTLVLLTVHRYVSGWLGADEPVNWGRTVVTVIAGLSLFNVILKPVLASWDDNVVDLIKQTTVYTAADYINSSNKVDLTTSATSMSSGIIIGDLSATPIIGAVDANIRA